MNIEQIPLISRTLRIVILDECPANRPNKDCRNDTVCFAWRLHHGRYGSSRFHEQAGHWQPTLGRNQLLDTMKLSLGTALFDPVFIPIVGCSQRPCWGGPREEENGLGVFWREITSAHEYYEVVRIYYGYCPISWPELPSNPKFSYFRSMEHRLGPLGSEHFPVCLAVYYYYSFTEHPSQLALHRHPNAFMAAIITSILRGALQKWALANGSTVGCRSWRCTCMQSQCLYYDNSSAGEQRRVIVHSLYSTLCPLYSKEYGYSGWSPPVPETEYSAATRHVETGISPFPVLSELH